MFSLFMEYLNKDNVQLVPNKKTRSSSICEDIVNSHDKCLSASKRLKVDEHDKQYIVTESEMMSFYALLDTPYVFEFLMSDPCLLISDKHLLSMVFAYFKRAGFQEQEYTKLNFFLALYLANEMEEDEECFKYEILPWALGSNWRKKINNFFHLKDKMFGLMNFRALVSNRCCEEVMSVLPDHWIWSRNRQAHHSGAKRRSDDEGLYKPRGPNRIFRKPCKLCRSQNLISGFNLVLNDLNWSPHFKLNKSIGILSGNDRGYDDNDDIRQVAIESSACESDNSDCDKNYVLTSL